MHALTLILTPASAIAALPALHQRGFSGPSLLTCHTPCPHLPCLTGQSSGIFTQHRLTSTIFATACAGSGPVPSFRVRGMDADEASFDFCSQLNACGHARDREGDCTNILVEDRGFCLTHAAVGEGVGREVLFAAYQQFIDQEATYF
ncbi:hypothetical protein B0H17DRAFT_1214630 [Mycena rosella]|uniref:Uncharacterized protein n=1 Tax=Mycena rosella TaxID=1033263 RepID=A0AAD7CMN9_MYCRO|nr:hypothetical protein B0H17DRAFT_1214630 [Mycena rosella]